MIFSYLIPLVLIPLLDFVWLGLLMKSFYLEHTRSVAVIGPNGFEVNYGAAALVYIFLSLGINFFVAPKAENISSALIWGFVFGVCVYGIYDFTNMATLKDWTLTLSLVDILWGGVLCAITSLAVFWVRNLGGVTTA